MRPPRRVPERLTGAPFARRDAPELSSRQLAGGAYERLTRGAYRVVADGDGDVTYADRVRAHLAVLPPRAVLVGASAAWALQAWTPLPHDPVEVSVFPPGSVRRREGLRLSARSLAPADVARRRVGLATTPLRTVLDVARSSPVLADTVPLMDAVLHAGRLTPADALAALDAAPGARGNRWARASLRETDPGAGSARESLLRLAVLERGLPRPVLQHAVPHPGSPHPYRLDLAWPDRLVALEYDGAAYHGPDRASGDLARHNALRALGWRVIQVDAEGFRHPEVYLAQLAALLG